MRKMKTTLITIALLVGVTFLSLFGYELYQEAEEAKQARYIYTGTVTAVVHGKNVDKVWLNSEPEVVKIVGTVELVLGEKYEITIDGYSNLINARILE